MKECRPRSNLKFVDFIWNYLILLQFKKYVIVAVPFETPKILYLNNIEPLVKLGKQICYANRASKGIQRYSHP
jgi:hypothetical protein